MIDNSPGAIPALRGFRKQFIHTLRRLIESEDLVFKPESLEDFSVHDSSDNLLEVVQVKDYTADLTISDLKSFFERCCELITSYPKATFTIATYGPLGPELKKFLSLDEQEISKEKKIKSLGFIEVFKRLQHIQLSEKKEVEIIQKHLAELSITVGDWSNAFGLLMQDLYVGAEQGKFYSKESFLTITTQIGSYLAARQAHHQEWFVSILPLLDEQKQDAEKLKHTFQEGASVGWNHILANLDIIRDKDLKHLDQTFNRNNIVILHGASGQGKSALSFRYLKNYYPEAARFEIRELTTAQRALEVATALAGYQIPLVFFVDADHKEEGLTTFLERVAEMPHIRCLVAIREEDWRALQLTQADISFEDIELRFEQSDALEIYNQFHQTDNTKFLDFDQAWMEFSGSGPLLEFVYLLTHTEGLKDRLAKQYNRILDEVEGGIRPESDLTLLQSVAIAGAFGTRIDLLKLPNKHLFKRSIDRLENEYLIRQSSDGRHILPFHQIRSEILTDLAVDDELSPWLALCTPVLGVISDQDLELFLLNAFQKYPETAEELIEAIGTINNQPNWIAINGIVKALLWKGIRDYIVDHKDLIVEANERFGDAWYVILDLIFIGNDQGESFQDIFSKTHPNKKVKQTYDEWRLKQENKEKAFVYAHRWLDNLGPDALKLPAVDAEWRALGQVLFWISLLNIEKNFDSIFDQEQLIQVTKNCDIECLAGFMYGAHKAIGETLPFKQWYTKIEGPLMDRLKSERNIPLIEIIDDTLKIHFVVPLQSLEDTDQYAENPIHALTIKHVTLAAHLFPIYSGYGSQGYGHNVLNILPNDDTTKSKIPTSSLPPHWVVQFNKVARVLASHQLRSDSWSSYCSQCISFREKNLNALSTLTSAIDRFLRNPKSIQQLQNLTFHPDWISRIQKYPDLPIEALDPFGYVEDGRQRDESQNTLLAPGKSSSLYLRQYETYFKAKGEYAGSLRNFMDLTPDTINKALNNEPIERSFLPGYNLAEAIAALQTYQIFYRNHFACKHDLKQLSELEKKEKDILHTIWNLWFLFIERSGKKVGSPKATASSYLTAKVKQLKKLIVSTLRKESNEQIRFQVTNDHLQYNRSPALWLTVNGNNPIAVYSAAEHLFNALMQAMGKIKLHSIEYYSIHFSIQNIILLPLCRGKLLEPTAWVLPKERFISSLRSKPELTLLDMFPKPISPETINKLGLSVWNKKILKEATAFRDSLSKLQVHIDHLELASSLPDLDEFGEETMQTYFDELRDIINSNFQAVIDTRSTMIDIYNAVIDADLNNDHESFLYLQAAVELLLETHETLMPPGFENGKASMALPELTEWNTRIKEIAIQLSAIYLLWCGYNISATESAHDHV